MKRPALPSCLRELALAALLVLLTALQTTAAEPVGWVQEVSGQVTISSGSTSSPATIGKGVVPKDKISTSRASRVQIMFRDKTVLALSEMSECLVGDVYLAPDDRKNARFNLDILKGVFGFLVGAIGQENPGGFTVKTPEVAVGIRGTEFASAVEQDMELHGLYEGGPVVVTATNFKKQSTALDPAKKKEICDAIEETIWAMDRAYRHKWAAGKHSEARKYEAKAKDYEKLLLQQKCE